MPIFPKLDLKVDTKVSKKNSETTDNSKRDSHNVSTSEANRYDQHYQASNSGNVEKKSVTNTDESNRSSTRTATNIDKSYHVHITNSIFQSTLSGASDQSSQPAIGASNLPAVEDLFHRTPVASPAPESKEASPAHELKLEILYSKMSAEMEEWALDICSAAFVRKTDAMSRAKHVCDLFEKQCGGSWNCVVGSEGNFVRYEENLYIQLKIGNQRVIAFKAPDKTENTRLQEQLLKQRLEFEELNKRLEKENTEINNKLEKEKAELKEEKITLSTELQNLEKKIRSLSDQNAILKQQRLEFEELNKRLEKENTELNNRLEKENAELKEEKITLSTELQNLEKKIISLSDQDEILKQELSKHINARDGDNTTPLLRAAKNNQASTVKALIDLGANLDLQDNDNYTALIWAAYNSNTEICKMLVEAGADVNIRNKWGNTALMLEAWRNIEVVKMLLAKGAQVNFADNNGNTALHDAAYHGHVEVVKLLVGHGANINVKSKDGITPLKRALLFNKTEVANYLKSVGATE